MNVEEVAAAQERAKRAEDLALVKSAAKRYLEACQEANDKQSRVQSIAIGTLWKASDTVCVTLSAPNDYVVWFQRELCELVERLHGEVAEELAGM